MKRIVTTCFAACIAAMALPVQALDFGLVLSDATVLSGSGAASALSQENQATVWLSTPTGASSSLYISALYQFAGNFTLSPAQASSIKPYAFTAGRTEWEGFTQAGSGARFGWSVGRIPFADDSGRILSGLFDGFRFDLSAGSLRLGAALAYTGLTFKEDARVFIDADDSQRWLDSGDIFSLFATPRLVAMAKAQLVEPLPQLDLGLELLAQFDLQAEGLVATNTQYLEPFLEGRLSRNLGWKLWGAALLGQDEAFFYSMAGGATLRFALPEALGLRIAGSALFAGGDYDGPGPMRAFTPVTLGSLAVVGSIPFSDALGLSLDANFVPVSGLSAGAKLTAALKPGAATPWLGLDGSARLAWRPADELTVGLSGGVFVPGTGTLPGGGLSWMASASATLRL